MNMSFRFICLGAAAVALSACSVPTYPEPEVVTLKPTPVQIKPAAPAAPQQAAAEVEEEVKPKNRWAHQPIGNTPDLGDSDGGDEDGGWG